MVELARNEKKEIVLAQIEYLQQAENLRSRQVANLRQTTGQNAPLTLEQNLIHFLQRLSSAPARPPATSYTQKIKEFTKDLIIGTAIQSALFGIFTTATYATAKSLHMGAVVPDLLCDGVSYLTNAPEISHCASSLLENVGIVNPEVTTILSKGIKHTRSLVTYTVVPSAIRNQITASPYVKPILTCAALTALTALSAIAMESLGYSETAKPLSDHLWNALGSSIARVIVDETLYRVTLLGLRRVVSNL